MKIQVHRAEFAELQSLQQLYRQEMSCQLIYDSHLARGLTDGYLATLDGHVAAYGAVTNRYDKGRLVEFYTLPQVRALALDFYREILAASAATHIAAQTNCPLPLLMLYDFAMSIRPENVLFQDAFTSSLTCPAGNFQKVASAQDEWGIAVNDEVVASGGFLCHYNPPYGDIFMNVVEPKRRKGFGSFLVQELKRVCYEAGKKPAARCNADNLASRKTLEKAGLLPCGRLLVGAVNQKS